MPEGSDTPAAIPRIQEEHAFERGLVLSGCYHS